MQYRAVLLILLLVTAGCATKNPTTGNESGEPQSVTVTVTEVVDGDTIDVRYRNGSTETVRLLGVDTPEVNGDTNPAEFEGVPETSEGRACLRAAAQNASSYTKERLHSLKVRLEFDPVSDRRGSYGRLLAYVYVDSENFNRRLVETGHARVYDSEFTKAESFYEAEQRAINRSRGVWRCRTAENTSSQKNGLTVTMIHADAKGNDNQNLNDEYVTFENQRNTSLNITGWTVTDAAGHTHTFSALTLAPGETITLHTGAGTDTSSDRYWGASGAVWNNEGDTIVVRDRNGQIVLRHEYA